jgi:hypothetical protein
MGKLENNNMKHSKFGRINHQTKFLENGLYEKN